MAEVVDIEPVQVEGLEDEDAVIGAGGFLLFNAENHREFDQKLRQEILEEHNYRCMVCGAGDQNNQEVLEIAHIQRHRGPGGLKAVNHRGNLGPLCTDCHNKHHRAELKFVKYDPDDLVNGLIVEDGRGNEIPKEDLYFYKRPTEHGVEVAAREYDKFSSNMSEAIEKFWIGIQHLRNLKDVKVDGTPLWQQIPKDAGTEEYYSNWRNFYNEKAKGKMIEEAKKFSTATQYISAARALPKLGDDWKKVHPGSATNIASALRHDNCDEEDKHALKTLATTESGTVHGEESVDNRNRKIRRLVSEIKGNQDGDDEKNQQVQTCYNCVYKQKYRPDVQGPLVLGEEEENLHVGSKNVYICTKHVPPVLISSLSSQEAINMAERKCIHHKQQ